MLHNMCSSSYLIKSNKLIGSSVIAGLGTIASLWTNCIFTICLQSDLYNSNYMRGSRREYYVLIFQTIQYEYIVICLIAIVTLIWGLTKSHWKYLLPWACLKLCENIAIFVGTYLILTKYYGFGDFYGIMPLGIAAIYINVHASLCVYKAYKRMLIKLPLKNLKNNEYKAQITKETIEEENIEIKVEELRQLSPENSNYNIPSENCDKV